MSGYRPTPAVAHFYGGPVDGRVQAVSDASFRLVIPGLREVRLTAQGAEETVPRVDHVYVRRGPALEGHVYYDYDGRET